MPGKRPGRSIAPQSERKQRDGGKQIAVGVDSLSDLPTHIIRCAKAGGPQVHLVEGGGTSSLSL